MKKPKYKKFKIKYNNCDILDVNEITEDGKNAS